ncbi:SHOCT domain-containing protein [Streptomyces sp. NPDC059010]|uniref:SHOCT domain-containing protein n=1 Tax=Streptomyces sp. NPDC059010 TaxID=3346695 RepID=UPI0036CEBED2
MMFWYDHDVSGWGWFAMSAGMILFWALIITAVVLLIRALNSPQEHPHPHPHTPAAPTPTPEDILRERLARGEIDEEEYRRRLAALHAGPLTKT